MKRILAVALWLFPSTAHAEEEADPWRDRDAVNAVFFEAFGNGLLYTVNYERIVPQLHAGIRVGASYFAGDIDDSNGSGKLKFASFPIVASYYLFGPTHHLQLGLGATILYLGASTDSTGTKFSGDAAGVGAALTGVVGYRYMPPKGWLDFGVGFTPLLRPSSGLLPWGGIHLGAIF